MNPRERIFTVPNLLSLFRLGLLVPILVFMSQGRTLWALFLMILGVITDFVDGYIARRWDQSSDLGRIIDPAVDKINVLVVTFFMVVSPLYSFPLWFFLFILFRELVLMACSSLVIRQKDVVMESNRPGKNSAFAMGMTVIFFLLDLRPYAWIVLWIAFALTLYSSYVYFRLFLGRLKSQAVSDSS